MTAAPLKALVLYASQTGNAEHIAKNIYANLQEKNILPVTHCLVLDDFEEHYKKGPLENLLILVSSTTGDGDAPDNSLKFWRFMRKLAKSEPKAFEKCRITVLGLGDTNYSNFGAHPKKLQKKIQEMGAEVFYECRIVDEVEGLEAQVDPWIAGLYECLAEICGTKSVKDDPLNEDMKHLSVLSVSADKKVDDTMPLFKLPYTALEQLTELSGMAKPSAKLCDVTFAESNSVEPWSWNEYCSSIVSRPDHSSDNTYTHSRPFGAKITRAACITTKDAVKRTLLIEIDIKGMNWKYEAGDSIGVICCNSSVLVNSLLHQLKLEPNTLVQIDGKEELLPSFLKPFKTKRTLFDLFKYFIDFVSPGTVVKKALLRILADEFCTNLEQKKMLLFLCSRQGKDEFKRMVEARLNLIELFTLFPGCIPESQDKKMQLIGRLCDTLNQLAPRYYSICSAPSNNDVVQVAFNVVDYDIKEEGCASRHVSGIATTFIDDICGKIVAPSDISKEIPLLNLSVTATLPVFPSPSHDFHLPHPIDSPIIMVGPGTGVAPFMSFLEHIKSVKPKQDVVLFYGCRDRSKDFLFKQSILSMDKDGIITKLRVCRSREPDNITWKYVQDQVRAESETIYDVMVNKNGRIYICG